MTKESLTKSVKTNNEPLPANAEEAKKIDEIKNILKQLPLKDSEQQEKLDKWANELYKILFTYDRSLKKLTVTQTDEYLEKLDKLLRKLECEIDKLPFEIQDLLLDPDTLCREYFYIFSDTNTIAKSRYLIEHAKAKNKDKKKGNEKGNKENPFNNYLSDRLAFIYYDLTGKTPAREIDGVSYIPKGKYFLFVEAIFKLGKIKASAEDHVRKSSKKFKETLMELIQQK